jgi:hypothetical protein
VKGIRQAHGLHASYFSESQLTRSAAELKIREADKLERDAWNAIMWAGGPAMPSPGEPQAEPTIAKALNAGYDLLEVKCNRCRRISLVALCAIRRKVRARLRKRQYLIGLICRRRFNDEGATAIVAKCCNRSDKELALLTVMSRGSTIGAKKLASEIAHRETEAVRGKLDFNVLIGAVVISGAARACLRKDRAAIRSAGAAAEAFRPLVPLVHTPPAKQALVARKKSISMIRSQFLICRRARN